MNFSQHQKLQGLDNYSGVASAIHQTPLASTNIYFIHKQL